MARGLNCTELFETYHFHNRPPQTLLDKYRLNKDSLPLTEKEKEESLTQKYSFEEDGFYNVVKTRVRTFLRENNRRTDASFFYKMVFIVEFIFVICLLYPAFVLGMPLFALLHGFFRGNLAVTGGHAVSHFSVFRGSWNQVIFRWASYFILSNPAIWNTSHVVSHHVHTLTTSDLQDNYPLKRVQPAMKYLPFHAIQHYYIWPVYLIGLPLWSLVDLLSAIVTIFTGKHEMMEFGWPQRIENVIVFSMEFYFTMLMPFFFVDFQTALLCSFLSNAIASMLAVLQIVVNHEVPDCMLKVSSDEVIDWGAHQVLTSHNYGVDSEIALQLSGGLNMQIEHHLFPSLHFSQLRAIAPIVQQTCKEYGLPYNTSSSIFEALQKHYHVLRINSTP